MVAQCGKGIIVSFKDDAGTPAYQVVAGLRTREIQMNAELVDVTSADSAGTGGPWREALDACGVRSVTISGSGLFVDDAGSEAVRDAYFENEIRDTKITVPGFGDFVGSFKVTSLRLGGEYNAAVTFDMTLESVGAVTFT